MEMTAVATYRPCPSCGTEQVSDLPKFNRDAWRIGMCNLCDFVFLRNPVEYTALEDEFAWEKTYVSAGESHTKARSYLSAFAQKVRLLSYRMRGRHAQLYLKHLKAGPVIDIGCGDLVRFDERFVPFGIELSTALQSAADTAMRELGGFCIHGAGADAIWEFEAGAVESVLMHSYLEHEVAYARVLDGCFRVLRPGGQIFIRVPNFSSLNRRIAGAKWPGFRYPDHVNYFTPASLQKAVESAGFKFKIVNRHKIWLDDNIQALAIKPTHN